MSLLGFNSIGRLPLGAIPPSKNVVSATFTSAGVGAALLVGAATFSGAVAAAGHGSMSDVGTGVFNSVLSAAGHGSMSDVGTGVFNSVLAAAGHGGMLVVGTGVFNSIFSSAGQGNFVPISYAFFKDAERACIHEEDRNYQVTLEYRVSVVEFDPNKNPDAIVAYVGPENRISIVPAENRVYQIGFEPRGPATPNRKRTC